MLTEKRIFIINFGILIPVEHQCEAAAEQGQGEEYGQCAEGETHRTYFGRRAGG